MKEVPRSHMMSALPAEPAPQTSGTDDGEWTSF
jgi:hypothetical protein